MRVILVLTTILVSTFARQLITYGKYHHIIKEVSKYRAALHQISTKLVEFSEGIEDLFKKFMRHELSAAEYEQFQDLIQIVHRREYAKSLEYTSAARLTLDCLVCRSAFSAVADVINDGQSDEEIADTVVTLCTTLGIESYNVCYGAVVLNIPIITYILRTTPEASSRTFCGLVLQTVGDPNTCVIDDSRFEWQVDLPEPPTITNIPEVDTTPLKVALLTDAHIDPLYEAFGVANCDEPTCCRKGQTPARSYQYKSNIDITLVDQAIITNGDEVMLDLDMAKEIRAMEMSSQTRFATRNSDPAGYWGDYRSCDTPIWAFDEVIDTITESHKDIDVVYYIGDTIDHGVWETTYDLINDMNLHVIDKIRTGFGDDVPVIPTIGNHESQPTNQFAPSQVQGELNTTWLYDALAEKWGFYLTDDAKATLRDRGDFSVKIRPGLRVISMNNNVAYKYNWWLVYDPLDAKRHLDWLVDELYAAELAGERVHILTHIPPGVHDLTYTWTREYNRIVNRFSSTIMAEFNGHTHSDEFKVFYSSDGTPSSVAWGAGSATSYSNYNLNYKIVDVNPVTYEPQRIENYVYNLTEANLTPNRRPHWFLLYDMKNTFGLADLSPASLDNLVNRMVTTNKELLDIYAAFFWKLSDTRWPYCDDNCKLDQLCKTVVTVLWEREKCNELRNTFYS